MSSLLVFNRVYILESGDTVNHVVIFDPALLTIAPITFSLVHLPHPSPLPKVKVQCMAGKGRGEMSCVGEHILKEVILCF
jgi:hypothetical protein